MRALGKDPASAARPPADWGLEPDVYLGTIDVYHQLHCLDMLRTNLRENFDHYHRTALSPLASAASAQHTWPILTSIASAWISRS